MEEIKAYQMKPTGAMQRVKRLAVLNKNLLRIMGLRKINSPIIQTLILTRELSERSLRNRNLFVKMISIAATSIRDI